MLRLNVVQMAHAELTSTIYRSILQPSQKGTQSVATRSKVTSGTHVSKVQKWTKSTCKGTPERIVKRTEVCTAFYMICMIILHVARRTDLHLRWRLLHSTICKYFEWAQLDVWGHFRVKTTVRHLCSSWTQRSQCTDTSIVYTFTIKDNSQTAAMINSYNTQKYVQYLQNGFIDTVD